MNESNLFNTARSAYHRISEENQKRLDEERARQKREAEQRIAAEIAESVKMWPEYAKNQTYSFGVCTVEYHAFHHGVVKFKDLPHSSMIFDELAKYGVPRKNIFLDNDDSNLCSYCVMVNFAKSE